MTIIIGIGLLIIYGVMNVEDMKDRRLTKQLAFLFSFFFNLGQNYFYPRIENPVLR